MFCNKCGKAISSSMRCSKCKKKVSLSGLSEFSLKGSSDYAVTSSSVDSHSRKLSPGIVVIPLVCFVLLAGSIGIYFGVTKSGDEDAVGSQNHERISGEHDGDKFKVGSDAVKSDATADSAAESDAIADSDATSAEKKLNNDKKPSKNEGDSENRRPEKTEKDEADSKKRETDKKKSDDENDDDNGILDRAKEEAKDAVEEFFNDDD